MNKIIRFPTSVKLNKCFVKNAEKVFRMTQRELKKYLINFLVSAGYKPVCDGKFIYAVGSLPVATVAHLDTVHKHTVSKIHKTVDHIWSAEEGIGGDDRCGVLIIEKIINSGLRPTVIFTEDEEIGCIGASDFIKKHECAPDGLKYIVEFDRANGDDCVFYSCDNAEFTEFVESYGFKQNYGSYSDICEIAPVWGVAAVNISCAYYNPHTTSEYVDMVELLGIIEKAKRLIADSANNNVQTYEYIEEEFPRWSYRGVSNWYDFFDYNDSFSNFEYPAAHESTYRQCGFAIGDDAATTSDYDFYTVEVNYMYDGYIIMRNEFTGEEFDFDSSDDTYFVDANGNVYVAACGDGCCRMSGCTAYDNHGYPWKFDEGDVIELIVID